MGTRSVHMHLWDTSGEEKYKSLTKAFVRGAVGGACLSRRSASACVLVALHTRRRPQAACCECGTQGPNGTGSSIFCRMRLLIPSALPAILVYDITEWETFDALEEWLQFFKDSAATQQARVVRAHCSEHTCRAAQATETVLSACHPRVPTLVPPRDFRRVASRPVPPLISR